MRKNTKQILTTAVIVTAGSALINRWISYTATMREITKSKQDQYFHWRGQHICYQVKGEGSPILLLHDVEPHTSGLEWKKLAERLAENHTVYVLDLVGCGKSDKPAVTYVCYYFVSLVDAFLREVVKEKATIITSGSAFDIAVMSAHQRKNAIRKIIAINPSAPERAYLVPTLANRLVKLALELPVFGTFLYHITSSYLCTKMRLQETYFRNAAQVSPLTLDGFYESAHLSEGRGRYLLASILGNFTNCYIFDALKKIDTEIAFLYSESAAPYIYDYKKYRKDIALFECEGKEKPHLEYPNATMEILRACLPYGDM